MIKRSGRVVNTSDEESDSDEEEEEPLREPSQPPRDPLEVEISLPYSLILIIVQFFSQKLP